MHQKLHFVVGKGGVGKTTVAAALARLFARAGRRTLAIEMDVAGRLPAMLGKSGPAWQPIQIRPRLSVLSIDGRRALEEYLGMIIPVKRLLSTVFDSRIYQYFVAAAPGLKELMTIGKIWYEVTREEDGTPMWDAVVVDAPATGHSLQYLGMPKAARDTFGAGLVQREAARVTALIEDPAITAVHLVTLAEDMPVSETLETHAQLTGDLHLPLGRVVVNRLHERRFDPAHLRALQEAAERASERDGAILNAVAERAVEETGWASINAEHLARLEAAIGHEPIVRVPYLFAEEFGSAELDVISRLLAAPMGESELRARQAGS